MRAFLERLLKERHLTFICDGNEIIWARGIFFFFFCQQVSTNRIIQQIISSSNIIPHNIQLTGARRIHIEILKQHTEISFCID